MKILSLDASSSTIGWAVVEKTDSQITLIQYNYIKPINKEKAEGNLTIRLDDIYTKIRELVSITQPDLFAIEDYAQKFSKGKSSANTIKILACVNETARLAAYHEKFRNHAEAIKAIPVGTARKEIKEKYNMIVKEKEDAIVFAKSVGFKPFTKARKGIDVEVKINEDVSDAIVIAYAACHLYSIS